MRSWDSAPRPKTDAGRTDSQDRMDRKTVCQDRVKERLTPVDTMLAMSWPAMPTEMARHLKKTSSFDCKPPTWSMRSWESVPRPKKDGRRTDSQGRMDHEADCQDWVKKRLRLERTRARSGLRRDQVTGRLKAVAALMSRVCPSSQSAGKSTSRPGIDRVGWVQSAAGSGSIDRAANDRHRRRCRTVRANR